MIVPLEWVILGQSNGDGIGTAISGSIEKLQDALQSHDCSEIDMFLLIKQWLPPTVKTHVVDFSGCF